MTKGSDGAPSTATDIIGWLQNFYSSNCDGDWEHQYGVEITTLDNPGWHVKIDLADTEYAELAFPNEKVERSSTDWIILGVKDRVLFGAGGVGNLFEILNRLRVKLRG